MAWVRIEEPGNPSAGSIRQMCDTWAIAIKPKLEGFNRQYDYDPKEVFWTRS